MIEHIFSIITLILIYKHQHNLIELFSKKNRIKRMTLIILSKGFSVLYLLSGVMSMKEGFSMVNMFEIEYGLFFLYTTYRLYNPSRFKNYKFQLDAQKETVDSDLTNSETYTISQLIRDTMICLEDDNFEKAQSLINKVDTQYAVDQNVVFLKQIVNHAPINDELEYSESFCY